MTDKYKKERDEYNRKVYSRKTLQKLKNIGKRRGLLNVDQYNKGQKNVLIQRLIKGKQLSDYSKDVLLERAQNKGILANATMSKETLLQKLKNPKLTDLNDKRLREIANKEGVTLRGVMAKKDIIKRLNNPNQHRTIQSLTKVATDNNIKIPRNTTKAEIIRILEDRNLITETPITEEEESNLGVKYEDAPLELIKAPLELIKAAKQKARNAREALINYKKYIKSLNTNYLTSRSLTKLNETLKKKELEAKEEHDKIFTFRKELSAFNGFSDQYVMDGSNIYDGRSFLREAKNSIVNVLESNRGIKARLYFNCVMVREKDGEEQRDNFYFHSELKMILASTDVDEVFEAMVDEIEAAIQKAENAAGTVWRLESIIDIKLHTAEWVPLNASSYMELPTYLKNKKAIINMKNKDDKCFLWCVLRALNPVEKNKDRVDKDLISKQDTLNMKGIKYPVSLQDINKFESLNSNISITVLGYNENDKVYPLRVSKYTGCDHDIILMLIRDEENSHYCLVNKLSALLGTQLSKDGHTRHFCLRCLNSFNCKKNIR